MYKYQLKRFSVFSQSIKGFEAPSIWAKCSKMAVQTGSVNLGQGFPDWTPPEFFIESLAKHIKNGNHQITRTYGSQELVNSIARNFQASYKRELDPKSNVLVGVGGVSLIYNAITSLVETGDEVIVFEPFYDCYVPQVQFVGGKTFGIPMIPPAKGNLPRLLIYLMIR